MMVEMSEERSTGLGDNVAFDWRTLAPSTELPADRTGALRMVGPLVNQVGRALIARQAADGHWCYPLEADATIAAEYILLEHFLGEIDQPLERRIAAYLRAGQAGHGGWPLYAGGELDISASVKAYFALKLAGDDPQAPHMIRARNAILLQGGAARSNVFTRIALALFGQVPWRAVPVMPAEIMLLPRWFPFHLDKVSYWSRTVIAPLLILMATKPRARNPRAIGIGELFVIPPDQERRYNANPTGSLLGAMFLGLDRVLHKVEPFWPKALRRRAIRAACAFVEERLNGEDGLGAIFPAMANAVMAFDTLGYPADDPRLVVAKQAVRKLLVQEEASTWVQPCLSPVWDTALACNAMLDAVRMGLLGEDGRRAVQAGLDWLVIRQITGRNGDWTVRARPDLDCGGWAFQYRNDHYPDVDDTAAVVCAMHRCDPARYAEPIERAEAWVLGMQSSDGGWGAFDIDNSYGYLNSIPFADHGALLDPPTADVTARCVSMLAQIGHGRDHPAIARALAYLLAEQEPDGSWFGRWGTNYIYGTWSVLSALNAAGEDLQAPPVRRAVAWLLSRQQADGGWGESCGSYWQERRGERVASTPTHTAWALLALMAAGEVEHQAVRAGIDWLRAAPRRGERWEETLYNAVGFPRVFYLHYHGYPAYFPLWALARYADLTRRGARRVTSGL
jgi:squalene-hopene/tetraprenyl-beta-curcumene cyclase